MKKFMDWLENSLAPKLQKITTLIWVDVIKDSLMQVLPFILLGSVFCCAAIVFDGFWTPHGWTMGKISLFFAFLIPFNYCDKKKYRKQRLIAGFTGLILYMIFVEPQVVAGGTASQNQTAYGAGGMFVAIVAGIISGLVFGLFNKFSFFKEDSPMPEFVREWFDALLPIALVVVSGWLVVDRLGIDMYLVVTGILKPLGQFCNTWYGMTFICFLTAFIYSMGISTWVLTPVTEPFRLANAAANLALVAAGTDTIANLSIFTDTTMYTCYLWIGGVGATLALVLECAFLAKSKELKALGRASLVPGLLNINEPIIFGAVAWNPLLMVPMWINAILMGISTWVFTKVIPLAKIPRIQFELWYTPYPISTFISTQGHIPSLIFVLLQFLLTAVVYYPFFKAYDDIKVKEESM